MSDDELRGAAVIEQALDLLRQVYEQAGNAAPAERRHVLTPGLRDSIRDCLKQAESDQLPVTEEWLRAMGFCCSDAGCFLKGLAGYPPEARFGFSEWTFVIGMFPTKQSTRGHVRRLCAALGITLKDSA